MLRRGGKRIRMDEPPPEYDAPPMTPMTPASELQEPYTPYTPYTPAAETPLHHPDYQMGYNQSYDQPVHHQPPQTPQQQHMYGHQEYDQQQQQQQQAYQQHQQQQQQQNVYQNMYEQQPPQTPTPHYQQQHTPQAHVEPEPEPEPEMEPEEQDEDMDHDAESDIDAHDEEDQQPAQNYEPIPRLTISIRGRGRGRGRGRIATIKKIGDQIVGEPPRKRGRPGRKPITEVMAEDEQSLYFIVRNGRTALAQVVDDWIDSYKDNRDGALLQLMQFFINAAGCKGKITPHMQATMEHAEIIRRMTEEFEEESGEYPLIQSGQQWKKFRSNFCEFVQLLVKQCQYSIIYDQYLMDNVISLLTGLSDSQVRAFRHTATLAAMKLMTALVDVALTVSVNLDNTQRQYESERQKSREKRASDRLESLMSKRQELEENMDEIKNMLTYMFKSVFVHRYRDTLPEIRSICMAEIGLWMKKFHQNFLDDSYLKYIGWTLHDKVGDVRLKCLQALQPLYASEELKGKLELFTSKFKDRIVAMTLDKEYDVAVQAVKLVISILKYHRDILTDKDCEHVYELVYSSHRAVAQAAGEFLNERLFIPDDEAVAALRTKRGKKRRPNTPLIRDLVQFFIESELHEHGAYLVDSLIESNDMMKDWECMTDLLLEEPGPMEEPLDDRQETSLIEIMVCCIKQGATGEPPVGRGPTRKQILSAKEVKQVNDDRAKLTEHLIPTLPQLLHKYLADPEKVANLLLIPQYFDLEIYTTSRQEKNLDLLLKLIQEVADKHSDTEVLETAAKTLEILCNDDYTIYSRCDIARSSLLDMVVNKYKEANDEYLTLIDGEEEPDEDETFALVSSVKKVSIFYSCHNMGPCNIWDSLYKNISYAIDGSKSLPEEATKYCISSCFFGVMWELHQIEMDKRTITHDAVEALRTRLHLFLDACKHLLANSNNQVFREEAYVTLCDLLIVFSRQLLANAHLSPLVYVPDRGLQHLLNHFIQTYVFIDDEDEEQDEHVKIEELHKRRNFLATFCKLIVYNVLPTKVAADVFKHYVRYYDDYGDIIKATLGKAREINKVNSARTMALALTMIFRELHKDNVRINRQGVDFISLKELAKRFALSFGLDAVKNREAITALHREGILFAVNPLENPADPTGPPPNLAFLEILTEFTNKLLKQDKRVVLAYLDRRIAAGMPSSRGEDWQPLLMYRNSLVHGEGDQPPQTSKRAYTRKRKHVDDDDDDDEDDDAGFQPPIEEPRETGRPKRRRRLEQTHPDIIGRTIRHKWYIDGEGVYCTGSVLGISAPGTIPEESDDGQFINGTCYDIQYDDEDFVRHLILEGDWQKGDIAVMGRADNVP
ncbi:cohesin subunit SA-2-like isoform X2 [Penaeus japonicus]|uniref:cohesin subunit SA-2-like isoform X2 n=1 Tax=Penaeus japonicus TaxID=27405 RepID=UPI001C71715F|nr:cohesin subunit SA-2-like isoform X2 [Penaeus japonicus]